MRTWAASLLMVVVASFPAAAGEINFLEDFVLAKDRTEALKQLIPGTESYYYFNCLHLQNTEQFDRVEELLKAKASRRCPR